MNKLLFLFSFLFLFFFLFVFSIQADSYCAADSCKVNGGADLKHKYSNINLYLDGSRSNLSTNVDSYVNITAVLTDGEGDIQVYKNSSLIYNGSSPSYNNTLFDSIGTFNITSFFNKTGYNSSYETWWVDVSEAPSVEEEGGGAVSRKRFNITRLEVDICGANFFGVCHKKQEIEGRVKYNYNSGKIKFYDDNNELVDPHYVEIRIDVSNDETLTNEKKGVYSFVFTISKFIEQEKGKLTIIYKDSYSQYTETRTFFIDKNFIFMFFYGLDLLSQIVIGCVATLLFLIIIFTVIKISSKRKKKKKK